MSSSSEALPQTLYHFRLLNSVVEHVLKTTARMKLLHVNSSTQDSKAELENYTIYPSGYVVLTTAGSNSLYTRHYYMGSQRIASRVGQVKTSLFQSNQASDTELKTRQLNDLVAYTTQAGFPEITFATAANDDTLYNEDGKAETTQKLFYHSDHLGTNSFITDSRCLPFQFFLNLPFGETMAEQYAQPEYPTNPYKFNGKELDTETGLYYYGARYYNPRTSVWLSVDPLAAKYTGFTPYNYTLNNPVMLIDPDGLETIFVF